MSYDTTSTHYQGGHMYWNVLDVLGNVLENTYFSWHVLEMYWDFFWRLDQIFFMDTLGAHFSHITYISHISSHVFTKLSHVPHILMQFILLELHVLRLQPHDNDSILFRFCFGSIEIEMNPYTHLQHGGWGYTNMLFS